MPAQWAPPAWQGGSWGAAQASPNVVWQDVTSNATYCSAASIWSQGGA